MAVRRPPDWAVYAATAAVLLGPSLLRRENADAPPALPAPSGAAGEGSLRAAGSAGSPSEATTGSAAALPASGRK